MKLLYKLRGPGGSAAPLIVGAAVFTQAFDAGAVVVALPAMVDEFHVPLLRLNLVIMAYLVAATASLPLCGWAADRFGARRTFLFALGGFALSSAVCMTAPDLNLLIAARAVEGCMGAMMLTVGRVIVLRQTPPDRVTEAFALLSMPVLLGPVLGPVVGGYVVSVASWRWLFAINVMVALPAMWAVHRFIAPTPPDHPRPLDILGAALIAGSLVPISFAVSGLADPKVSRGFLLALAAIGLTCAGFYARHARRHSTPIISLDVLGSPVVRAANVGGIFQRMTVSAVPFLLTLLFQSSFKLDAATSGQFLFAIAMGSLLSRAGITPLIKRVGFRRFMIANSLVLGLLVCTAGFFRADTPYIAILLVLFVQGCARAVQLIGIMTLSFAGVGPRETSTASTITSVTQQFALSLGIALSMLALSMVQALRGTEALASETVGPALIVIGALSMLAAIFYYRLPADAGSEFAGARP